MSPFSTEAKQLQLTLSELLWGLSAESAGWESDLRCHAVIQNINANVFESLQLPFSDAEFSSSVSPLPSVRSACTALHTAAAATRGAS